MGKRSVKQATLRKLAEQDTAEGRIAKRMLSDPPKWDTKPGRPAPAKPIQVPTGNIRIVGFSIEVEFADIDAETLNEMLTGILRSKGPRAR